ncbi:hypothetical protein GCM10011608_38950 [Micromonospora sonchi]|uniref:Large ribosomal subunit protein bL36 n=1 Tax=Micromonospora sonchi TaxID=1763543 RepID=A0A917U0Y5_9ACTN|nr:hypothetical protein GCM10011608_38950 [Micromonospora sonchi]
MSVFDVRCHATWVPGQMGSKATVKVKPSVKRICNKCQVIRRHGRVIVICADPRHKQRQG